VIDWDQLGYDRRRHSSDDGSRKIRKGVTIMTTKDLKSIRVAAEITRGELAEASGISMYRIDRIERHAEGVSDDDRKQYDATMAKLLKAKPAKKAAEAKPAKKTAPAKKATARKATPAKPKTDQTTQAA
jgi:transcriptional regulator with XRE-family HTH domain